MHVCVPGYRCGSPRPAEGVVRVRTERTIGYGFMDRSMKTLSAYADARAI